MSIDGSAAYLISKIKTPAGVSARNDTYSLGRFGDDGKLLWKTTVGNPPRILYADGNTVFLEEDQAPNSHANGYSAKDGKLLYKFDLERTGQKVGGVVKDNPLRQRTGSGYLANHWDKVGIFSNGDSLTADQLRHHPVDQHPPYSVQRVGKITWSVGSAKLPAHYVSGNQNRVLVKGQSEKELVALDSLTGKAVGDPIPIAGNKSALCGVGVPALLPDKLAALQCIDASRGLFGYIISLP